MWLGTLLVHIWRAVVIMMLRLCLALLALVPLAASDCDPVFEDCSAPAEGEAEGGEDCDPVFEECAEIAQNSAVPCDPVFEDCPDESPCLSVNEIDDQVFNRCSAQIPP